MECWLCCPCPPCSSGPARGAAGSPPLADVPAPRACFPARRYVQWIEDQMGVHCKWIGVGPGRDAVVVKPLGR